MLREYFRDETLDACSFDLAWQVERTLSNGEHDRGAIRRSIVHMRRVIDIKNLMKKIGPDGHDYVWLGYKYLCRIKRSEPGENKFD